MPNRLVIFDCDGTLVDSEVVASKVFPEYWATHNVFISEDEFKENFIGTGSNASIVKETFSKMPEYAEKEGDELFDIALETQLDAVEGIEKILASLNADICVASNSSFAYIQRALALANLCHFFELVFSAEHVENPKPAPDLFLHASRSMGFAPENCIVVEDSVSGIQAAKNAEMKVIGFTGARHFTPKLETRIREANPDWVCGSVDELNDLLNDKLRGHGL